VPWLPSGYAQGDRGREGCQTSRSQVTYVPATPAHYDVKPSGRSGWTPRRDRVNEGTIRGMRIGQCGIADATGMMRPTSSDFKWHTTPK
jgi:hypothetical protein